MKKFIAVVAVVMFVICSSGAYACHDAGNSQGHKGGSGNGGNDSGDNNGGSDNGNGSGGNDSSSGGSSSGSVGNNEGNGADYDPCWDAYLNMPRPCWNK